MLTLGHFISPAKYLEATASSLFTSCPGALLCSRIFYTKYTHLQMLSKCTIALKEENTCSRVRTFIYKNMITIYYLFISGKILKSWDRALALAWSKYRNHAFFKVMMINDSLRPLQIIFLFPLHCLHLNTANFMSSIIQHSSIICTLFCEAVSSRVNKSARSNICFILAE